MKDIFDELVIDQFDELEIPTEDKVIFSEEIAEMIKEAVKKEWNKLKINEIITRLSRDMTKKESDLKNEIKKTNDENKRLSTIFDEKLSQYEKKEKLRFEDVWNALNSEPWYQFGGYPLNGVTSGSNPLYVGDADTDGSWRFSFADANAPLLVEHLESGSWKEKGSFIP